MAFEVRCPECSKLYAAEWRMVGKRIRCRKCQAIFLVGQPAAAPVVAGMGGSDSIAEPVDPIGTAAGLNPIPSPPAENDDPFVGLTFSVDPKDAVKPSKPLVFPGSRALEAWLPLSLGFVAVIWSTSETIADRGTHAWSVPVRLAVLAGLYFALVLPLTLRSVRGSFKKMRHALPPSTWQRAATTFGVPACLAYVLWLESPSPVFGFALGCILGLVVSAAAFCLLFRLEPEESAHPYAVAGGTFLGAATGAALLFVGMNFLLNQAILSSKAAAAYQQSPLGSPLTWNTPPDAAKTRPNLSKGIGKQMPQPAQPSGQQPEITAPPLQTNPVAINPPTRTDVSPSHDAGLDTGTYQGPSIALDSDPFIAHIRSAKLPWVKRVYQPADVGVFERVIAPIVPSPHMGFVRLNAVTGRAIHSCVLIPTFQGNGVVPLEDASDAAVPGRCGISPDGEEMLRLERTTDGMVVAVIPFRGSPSRVTLTPPQDKAQGLFVPANGRRDLYNLELLGVLPGRQFLVRWSRAGDDWIQVYDYGSPGARPSIAVNTKHSFAPGVYAVSNDGTSFATIVREDDRSVLVLCSLADPSREPREISLKSMPDATDFQLSGLAFSPDGARVAVLMERDTDALVCSWGTKDGKVGPEARCKVPGVDDVGLQSRGRSLDWLTNATWLIRGRTVVDAASGAVRSTITTDVVTDQQLADDHTIYLHYFGDDGHPHVAVLEFDPAKLAGPHTTAHATAVH